MTPLEFKQRKERFLEALSLLANEHGVTVGSCGCCGGWDLYEMPVEDKGGRYESGDFDNYKWVIPKKVPAWDPETCSHLESRSGANGDGSKEWASRYHECGREVKTAAVIRFCARACGHDGDCKER